MHCDFKGIDGDVAGGGGGGGGEVVIAAVVEAGPTAVAWVGTPEGRSPV